MEMLDVIEDRIELAVDRWIARQTQCVTSLVEMGSADFEFGIELYDGELPCDAPPVYCVVLDNLTWRCVRGGQTGDGITLVYRAFGGWE